MSEATLLESRVDKLEQDNRRLKLTVGALLLVLAAVPLIGAVMPEQIPELIQARSFHVNDESGTMRSVMDVDGIMYIDENANVRAQLGRVVLKTPSTGAETTYPAQVVLHDVDGNVIWRALGR